MKGECLCDDCDYETCLCSQCDSSDDCKDGDACNYAPEKPKKGSVEEKIKDGGGSFPVFAEQFTQYGMFLRDYFSGQALAGLIDRDFVDPGIIARLAYKISEAMLAEREKRNSNDT